MKKNCLYISLFLIFFSCKNNISDEHKIEKLINEMSIEEKIGQMTQLTLGFLSSNENQHDGNIKNIDTLKLIEAVNHYKVGSIFNSAGSAYSTEKWHEIINYIQFLSQENENKIPVLYGIDAIHGATYTKTQLFFHIILVSQLHVTLI